MLSVVPCKNVSVRTFLTFIISRLKIFRVWSCSRRISGKVSPRLLTSSMFRSDSVITPDILFVSRLIARWVVLSFVLNNPVSDPNTITPITKIGISIQLFVTAYTMRKTIPMTEEKRTLMAVLLNIWVSILTFCNIESVSPLR